jgi:Soluble lytic murein transglycosylase and related regulatory proteins (some contain LysM/invasin domains)
MIELILVAIAGLLGVQILQNKKTKTSDSPIPEVSVTERPSVPYGILFERYSSKYNVPIRLMVAIVDHESNFNPKAINYETKADIQKGHNVDSVGLGQILYPDTAVALDITSTKDKLMQPEYNLNLTGMLLKQLLNRYPKKTIDGFHAEAVAAYNAGSARYSNGEFVNQSYVDKVRSKWFTWRNL